MKMSEIRALSVKDLEEKLAAAKKDLFDYKFQHATSQLEKTSVLPATKKTIARYMTVLTEKKKA